MKDVPLISVLMSTRNAAGYLEAAIESVLGQTFCDFEFLIVDDGSSDETPEILKRYIAKDARLRVITNTEGKGLAASLNRCIGVARGRYFARMDSDDVCEPERFSRQVEFLNRNPEYVAVGSWLTTFGDKQELWKYPVSPGHAEVRLFFGPPIAHPTAMIRAAIMREHEVRYDEAFTSSQDYELWERLSSLGRIGNISVPLLRYRVHASQTSGAKRAEQAAMALRVSRRRWQGALNFSTDDRTAGWLIDLSRNDQRSRRDSLIFVARLVLAAMKNRNMSLLHVGGRGLKILLRLFW